MGDSKEGPSRAAHRARPIGPQDAKQAKGLFARIFSNNSSQSEDSQTTSGNLADIPVGGLGNLQNLRVEDVAIPRADIVALPSSVTFDEMIKVFKDCQLSRLPVYDDSLDMPLGMVHLKDIAFKYGFNGKPKRFGLKRLLRPVIYAPPSMPIGVLLQKMQSEASHMALVIDEYGGVDGLLTIEDLVEQVVGEIIDEHDTAEEAAWIEESPGVYMVQARASLDEFEEIVGQDFASDTDDETIDTLGGLVIMMTGRVPARGEVISHPSGFEFEIVDADPRRIKRLRVCRRDLKAAE